MQIRRDDTSGAYIINSYQPGTVVINKSNYHSSVIVSREKLITNWRPTSIQVIDEQDIEEILKLNPDVILLGTGATLEFPDSKKLAPAYKKNLGVEIMDSSAACRTFRVLTAEEAVGRLDCPE